MPIPYSIIENPLQPDTFYARTERGLNIDLEKISRLIAARAPYSENTVKSVINHLIDVTEEILLAGNTPVIDGLVYFTTSVPGKIHSPDAVITPSNAELQIHAHEARTLQERLQHQVQFHKVTPQVKAPIVNSVYDHASDFYNAITLGGIIHLEGEHLKVNPKKPDEGVFLSDGTTETRLAIYSLTANKNIDVAVPSVLNFTEDQALEVIVRTRYTENGDLRTGKAHHYSHIVYHRTAFPMNLFGRKMTIETVTGYQADEHLRLNTSVNQDNQLMITLKDQDGTSKPTVVVENTPFVVQSANSFKQVELKVPSLSKFIEQEESQAIIKIPLIPQGAENTASSA